LHLVDLRREYRRNVLEPFLREYQAGRTPNPCIICNRLVKFGYLLDRAGAAGIEFDRFATGHYVRIATDRRSGRFVLRQAKDEKKDQTYFLYRLSQSQLARTLFPLGMMTKVEVRAYAQSRGLPVSDKEESQDFFSGDRASLCGGSGRPGPIADRTGKVLGRHRGIALYTIGQRKGLGIAAGKPLYVTAIIPETDTVVVGEESECYRTACTVSDVNYLAVDRLEGPLRVRAKIRSGQIPAPALLRPLARGTVELVFDRPQWAVTPGQSAVFYRRKTLVGGGIIECSVS